MAGRYLAAQRVGQQLQAVTDAEHGHTGLEHGAGQRRCAGLVDAVGPPDRMMPDGRVLARQSAARSHGTSSAKTCASRTRRQINWLYWLP